MKNASILRQVIPERDEKTEMIKDPLPGNKPKIIACIPAYNDETTLASVIIRVKNYVDKIYVCNDGSSDDTAEIAKALGAEVIGHLNDVGYAVSLVELFNEALKADADYIITLDAYGKKYANEIPNLLKALTEQNADIVTTAPDLEPTRGIPIKDNTTKKKAIPASNPTESSRGFRAYSRKALYTLPLTEIAKTHRGLIDFNTEILNKATEKGLTKVTIPLKISEASETPSEKQTQSIIDKLLDPLRKTSINHPIGLYGIPGFIVALGSLLIWAYLYITFNKTGYLSTNTMILGIGSITMGLILIVTAIILWVITTTIPKYQ